ncbi:MAG: hybrid sensor histidine kinase/response regulator transcription factor [Bacteroidota bacterium]
MSRFELIVVFLLFFTFSSSAKHVDSLIQLASSHLNKKPDSSIYFARKAVESTDQLSSKIKAVSILGDAFQNKQDYESAVSHYFRAIALNSEDSIPGILANAYNGLSMAFYAMEEMEKAEKYSLKAADEKLAINDYLYYSVIRSNLAVIYTRNGEFKKANKILFTTEEVLLENEKTGYLANIYQSIGANYESGVKNLDSAAYYYEKSIAFAKEHDEKKVLKAGLLNLANIAASRRNYSTAVNQLNQAKDVDLDIPFDQLDIAIYKSLSDVYDTLENHQKALIYFRKAKELETQQFNLKKRKQIADLEMKYETAKKQREIERQKKSIKQSKIEAAAAEKKFYIILFAGLLFMIVISGIAVYFWQKRRVVQQLEREKTKLFENIVHDIRTPLTLITGPLEMVKKTMHTDEKLAGQVDLIERNTEKLVRLVNELLDASKLEKGKFKPHYAQGNINALLDNCYKHFRNEANQKNIRLTTQLEVDDKQLVFPANVVEKVVNNLLSNSLKYCPKNSKVHLSASIENKMLLLTVKDDGPGIAKKDQEKVFNRFYTVNENNQKGTGIGLAIVKDLIELVEGEIDLITQKQQGTTFICRIPLQSKPVEKLKTTEAGSLQSLLVVDDDVEIVQFVADIFRDSFEIMQAYNGQEGIELAKSSIPDVVLTDIMMPVQDGIALIKELKAAEISRHIPIVALSAKSSLESRLEGLEHGADAYVPKPFSPDELQLIVKNILTTVKQNQREFQENIQLDLPFDERLQSQNEFVNKAVRCVIDNIDNSNYTINELAEALCVSRSQLHRKISSLTGFSSTHFIKMIRLEKAKDLLKSGSGNVTEVAYMCGFNSQSYFTKSFKSYFGKRPSSIKKQ